VIIEAECPAALPAEEVDVAVFMMVGFTTAGGTQGVTGDPIGRRDDMHDTFLHKRVKRTVNGHTVVVLTQSLLDLPARDSTSAFKNGGNDLFPDNGYPDTMAL